MAVFENQSVAGLLARAKQAAAEAKDYDVDAGQNATMAIVENLGLRAKRQTPSNGKPPGLVEKHQSPRSRRKTLGSAAASQSLGEG